MNDHPVAPSTRKGKALGVIGQLLSALDDRDPARALRVLEPERDGGEANSDQQDAPRCVKCATRGE
jgi:hypothetical protein